MNKFGIQDQLYAYWASMMVGAHAYCYGAHGIWNGGDGKFLAHWGKQTFDKAQNLVTPRLIGESHKLFSELKLVDFKKVEVLENNGQLVKITRSNQSGQSVSYIPDMRVLDGEVVGKIFLPVEGKFSSKLPRKGQVVIFSGVEGAL